MTQYKKGMLIYGQDEQTSSRQRGTGAQRSVVLCSDSYRDVQHENKRVRRFRSGMMVFAPRNEAQTVK